MLGPFIQAPVPFSAKNNSSLAASNITPETTLPLCSSAIDIAQCGRPCKKLVVPSNGSTIQRRVGSSPSDPPVSSPNQPYVGRASDRISLIMPSAAVSAFDTKSPAPLRETCKFSTSLKSFTRERPAMRAAFIIVFRFALPGIITLSVKRKAAILTF